jgi:hypothetical protein
MYVCMCICMYLRAYKCMRKLKCVCICIHACMHLPYVLLGRSSLRMHECMRMHVIHKSMHISHTHKLTHTLSGFSSLPTSSHATCIAIMAIHRYKHTYILVHKTHERIHKHVCTYMHTYMHTYIHTSYQSSSLPTASHATCVAIMAIP